MNLRFSEKAYTDLVNIAVYLTDKAGPEVAHKVLEAIERANDLILSTPGIGAPRDYGRIELSGMRMYSVPRFSNYLIFYRPTDTEVEILRIFHGAQNIEQVFIDDLLEG